MFQTHKEWKSLHYKRDLLYFYGSYTCHIRKKLVYLRGGNMAAGVSDLYLEGAITL